MVSGAPTPIHIAAAWVVGTALQVTTFACLLWLASRLYGVAAAIPLAVFAVIPCCGLLLMLLVNANATAALRRNGVRVGFLGANRDDLVSLGSGRQK